MGDKDKLTPSEQLAFSDGADYGRGLAVAWRYKFQLYRTLLLAEGDAHRGAIALAEAVDVYWDAFVGAHGEPDGRP